MGTHKERLRRLGIFSKEMCKIYDKHKDNKMFRWLVNKDLGMGFTWCFTHQIVIFKLWCCGHFKTGANCKG